MPAGTMRTLLVALLGLALLALAAAATPARAAVPWAALRRVAADEADPCQDGAQSCLDESTLLLCADLGSGLIPVSKAPCPADFPACRQGVCTVRPTTTTTTTTTVGPDSCLGQEASCKDVSTVLLCADLGYGLTPVATKPCTADTLCRDGTCRAAPSTTAATTTVATSTPSYCACDGKVKSCVDSRTLRICGDLGAGLQPVREVQCPPDNPVCDDGVCRADPSQSSTATPASTSSHRPTPTTARPATKSTTSTTTTTRSTTTTTRPTTTPATTPTPTPTPQPDICGGRLSVCGDCYTKVRCARLGNHLQPVSNVTCGVDAPYCVRGACKADLPADSACTPLPAPASTFKCYGSGYFPDPADCRRYHLCVAGKAYDYDCAKADGGLVYDSARALCVPLGEAQCFAFDCRGRANSYLTYGPDQTLYALCVSDDSSDALIARCPPGQRLLADPDDPLVVNCVPFCARAGRTADTADATGAGYYECFASSDKDSGKLLGPLKGSCPEGSVFSADKERCVAGSPAGSTIIPTASTSTTTR